MGLQWSSAPSKGQTTTISRLVIYHNRIQNHKHQSSLKYIRDTVYLFIKACQGFLFHSLPLNPSETVLLSEEPHQPGSHTKLQITQKPTSEAGEKAFALPAVSFHFHFQLICNYAGGFELIVIDGCKRFQSFINKVFVVCDFSGLLCFNEHGIHHGIPLLFIPGFKLGQVRT